LMDWNDCLRGVNSDFFWFKAKDELIGILLGRLKATPGKAARVLDVGAGTADDLQVIGKAGDVYVVDINPEPLKFVPDSLIAEKRCCDVCNLPYPDGFFDVVVAFDVLEHVEDDDKALGEIYRVLKRGGHFVFTVPSFNRLYGAHDRALSHFRRYNRENLSAKMGRFKAVETGYWVFSLFAPVVVMRLLKRTQTDSSIDVMSLPQPLNHALYQMLRAENWLIKNGIKLPIGLTIYGVYRKDG
jgi:SAM-dependent methyltransferase